MEERRMVFVTGYFGARIREEAERIASRKGWPILDLDEAIETKDGRSITRLCMMGGEHAYRNAEYELVEELCGREALSEGIPPKGAHHPDAEPRGSVAEHDPGADAQDPNMEGLVVACGDGILYDDDSRALILQHELVIAGEEQSVDELWQNARQDAATYHAFMKFGTEEEKRAKFEAHHQRQKKLFAMIRNRT